MIARVFRFTLLSLVAAAPLVIACDSNEDDVCDSIGACAHGGSSDWTQACQDETKLLKDEAGASGCRSQFDAYFSCANSKFECRGATPDLSACAAQAGALDACFEKAEAGTACRELAVGTKDCRASRGPADGGTSADGGAPTKSSGSTDLSIGAACTLARDCEARCYLNSVSDPCAPAVDELSDLSACTASCPRL